MEIRIDGFCYHCLECKEHFLFEKPAIEHSKTHSHLVTRSPRQVCTKGSVLKK